MEFELVVIGASDGTPVPDKIFFRIAGFEPGINLDGAGVFWLTGGGGGIDKLYDSIFGSGLPPATVLLTVDFEVMKVMEARCDLSLSLRGFRIKLSDVKIKGTKLVIIKQGELGVEWYGLLPAYRSFDGYIKNTGRRLLPCGRQRFCGVLPAGGR